MSMALASTARRLGACAALARAPRSRFSTSTPTSDQAFRQTVGDLIPRGQRVHFVKSSESVETCASVLHQHKCGALLVIDATNVKNIAGIISERDFVKPIAEGYLHDALVKDLMTPASRLITVAPSTDVVRPVQLTHALSFSRSLFYDRLFALRAQGVCMELMRLHSIRHLPVMSAEEKFAGSEMRVTEASRIRSLRRNLTALKSSEDVNGLAEAVAVLKEAELEVCV